MNNQTNIDLDDFRTLSPVAWVPVPGEGWNIQPATPSNPHVKFLNGQWNFTIRDREPAESWYRIRDDSWWAWDKDDGTLRQVEGSRRQHPLDEQFFRQNAEDVDWKPISVPDHWETQAFSQPVFAHCNLDKDDKVGYYRRRFRVPEQWNGQDRVILQAEGVAASAEVYVNEECVGYHDGGFAPFQMDVTDAIQPGDENLIAIRVVKGDVSTVHDNSGQWMLSGIWRDIFLFHVPAAHITDMDVAPDFDPATKKGHLDVQLRGSHCTKDTTVNAVLYPWDSDEPVAQTSDIIPNNDGDTPAWSLSLHTGDIQPWTPETPTMYRLECRLVRDGEVIERVREEVGFRRFSADGEQFLLNGEPYTIRGVTRHEIKQGRGRSLSVGDMLAEIRLMHRANITGVRSHPYPFDPRWIKLCARHGILVCSGYCLCGYNSWGNPWAMSEVTTYPNHEADIDPGYRELFHDRYEYFAPRIFARLKNMTAVFAWSLSNESSISKIFVPVAHFLRDHEREGRFILSAGDVCIHNAGYDDKHPELKPIIDHVRWDCMNADTEHYPERYTLEELPGTVPWNEDHPRPMFYTESAHVFCNRDNFMLDPGMLGDLYGLGLKRIFNKLKSLPGVGGYFIFEWCEQSVMQKGDPAICDSFLKPWHGYATFAQNLKGLLGPNHEPKPAYHNVRKVYSRVKITPEQIGENQIRLRIQNEYSFINLNQLKFALIPQKESGAIGTPQTLDVDAEPGERSSVNLSRVELEGVSSLRIEVYEPPRDESVYETTIHILESDATYRPDAEPEVSGGDHSCDTRAVYDNGLLHGIATATNEIRFLDAVRTSLGTADTVGGQRYVGMGHVDSDDTSENFVTAEDVCERDVDAHNIRNDGNAQWSEICRLTGDRGTIKSRFLVDSSPEHGAVRIRQEISRDGDPVWLSGLGLAFSISDRYRKVHWERHGGLWADYPEDHPDRLVGEEILERDEYPPINPFRHPSFSTLLPVRNARRVVLSGNRAGTLCINAPAESQRVTVRSEDDHRRSIFLLADAYCSHPYHEFSFHRNERAMESLLELKPLRSDEPVELAWDILLEKT